MLALPMIATLSSTMQIFEWMNTCSVAKTFPRNFAQLRSEKTEMWSDGWGGLIREYRVRLSHAYINTLLPQPTEDRVRSPADGPVLTFHNNTELGVVGNVTKETKMASPHRTCITVIDGRRVARKKGNEDTTFPWRPFSVCPDCPMHDRVANLIIHFRIVQSDPGYPARLVSKQPVKVAWTNGKEWGTWKQAGLTML